MTRSDLLEAVRDTCVTVLGVAPDQVAPQARLKADLGADSLDVAELVMALEDRVGTTIRAEGLTAGASVEDVIALVEECLGSVAP